MDNFVNCYVVVSVVVVVAVIGDDIVMLAACTAQANCAASTANKCATATAINSKQPCAKASDGYHLVGDSPNGVPTGTSWQVVVVVVDVVFVFIFVLVVLDNIVMLAACTAQANCATSTASKCATATAINTKQPCTKASDGYHLVGSSPNGVPTGTSWQVVVVVVVVVVDPAKYHQTAPTTTVFLHFQNDCHAKYSSSWVSNGISMLVSCRAACAGDQTGCTTSTANTCSTVAGATTKLICTKAAAGYTLVGSGAAAKPTGA